MVDASKGAKGRAKKATAKPEMPTFDPDDTDEQRAEKYRDWMLATEAWQAEQPTIETWDELLAIEDLQEGPLFIPEWGKNVVIRAMTRAEYVDLDTRCRQGGDLDVEKLGREAIQLCMVKPVLPPDAPLWSKNVTALKRIIDAILERSGVLGEVAAEVAAQFQD